MLAVRGPAQGTSCSGWILRDAWDSALSCTGGQDLPGRGATAKSVAELGEGGARGFGRK